MLSPEEHARIIATPSALAKYISMEEMGHQYVVHPWIAYLEREILAMLQRPGVELMIVSVPPQEGKSSYLSKYLPAWYLGLNPDHLVILAMYAETIAEQFGMKVRNILERWGPELFGVGISGSMGANANWRTTKGYGGMLSAGILGGITGNPGMFVLLDDVLKGMEDATSSTVKRKVWDEIKGSVETRWQNNTKQVLLATRWAVDDPSGRYLEEALADDYNGPPVRYINIKAQAGPTREEVNEPDYDPKTWRDVLGRQEGEYLQGQHSAEFFRMKKPGPKRDSAVWFALYQGEPQVREGGLFPTSRWKYFDPAGELPHFTQKVRVWDLAASENSGADWTVGLLMARTAEADWYVLDVQRVRKNAAEVKELVKRTAEADGRLIPIRIEQERSGAGISTVEFYRNELLGWNFDRVKASGTKEERAWAYSSYQNVGKVFLPKGAGWVGEFVEEHALMTGDGREPPHDDQIDTGAYAVLEMVTSGEIEILDMGDIEALVDEALEDILDEADADVYEDEPGGGFMRALSRMANPT